MSIEQFLRQYFAHITIHADETGGNAFVAGLYEVYADEEKLIAVGGGDTIAEAIDDLSCEFLEQEH